ncbi:hypothetical protein MAR_005719 [Mya arenaria]|uniref:G-protein coupled receptors family 1 profile domain-containing protein n=1 Tax=Mya arenaria TaxID=6604 RepID=A0ABY7F2L5_MYAAR|nr:hypothetical protein MAR_005719 [Mya arenaria]
MNFNMSTTIPTATMAAPSYRSVLPLDSFKLPQGVLILCCLFLRDFFEKIYIPLGDVMDIIALINSSVNFVLYCTMSQEFRITFIRLVCAFFRVKQQQQRTYRHTKPLPQRRYDNILTMETDL